MRRTVAKIALKLHKKITPGNINFKFLESHKKFARNLENERKRNCEPCNNSCDITRDFYFFFVKFNIFAFHNFKSYVFDKVLKAL